jgi:hypothetical protein
MALPVNSSSIAALSSASTLIGSLTNLLLASPQTTQGYQPNNPPGSTGLLSLLTGPPSILFHYEGEQSIQVSSDITDHFIEDNTSIQDQVALKPIIVNTHGIIGELNNVPPAALALLQQSLNTLTAVGGYSPTLTLSAQNAYNKAFAAYQLASNATNAAVAAVSSISGNSGESVIGSNNGTIQKVSNQNRQQTYFQQLYGYWQSRTFFTIQTPWAIFQNMVILSLNPVQSADDRMSTDFGVTFKQINIASTALLGPVLQGSGRNITQSAPVQNNGVTAVNPGGPSVSTGLTNMAGSP